MYLSGRRAHAIRMPYSTVNSTVKAHSARSSSFGCSSRITSTLSHITTNTLSRMAMRSKTSNSLPADVSASKIIS